jgi:hypothetical protein
MMMMISVATVQSIATAAAAAALTLLLLIQAASAGDPDMLQDFCVADTSSGLTPLMNGFPCKARSLVTSQDFLFTTFREAGLTIFTLKEINHSEPPVKIQKILIR